MLARCCLLNKQNFAIVAVVDTPILQFVMVELAARKGQWPDIAKGIEPDSWRSYYSWLTKLAQGRIPDPSVNKIQRLADHFRSKKAKAAA